MKFATPLIFSIACLLSIHQAQAAKVYKWADDKGVIHYSAQPPVNKPTEVIKPQTGHSDPINYASSFATSSAANTNADNGSSSLKDKERCEAARKNQETLKTYTHIKIKGDDGQFRFLTPEEQQQKLNEANKAVEESCE